MQQQQSFSDGESIVRKVVAVKKKKKTGQILAKVMSNHYTSLLNFAVQHIHNTFTGFTIAVRNRAHGFSFLSYLSKYVQQYRTYTLYSKVFSSKRQHQLGYFIRWETNPRPIIYDFM